MNGMLMGGEEGLGNMSRCGNSNKGGERVRSFVPETRSARRTLDRTARPRRRLADVVQQEGLEVPAP